MDRPRGTGFGRPKVAKNGAQGLATFPLMGGRQHATRSFSIKAACVGHGECSWVERIVSKFYSYVNTYFECGMRSAEFGCEF
jgi:hypothetical protein